LPRGGGLGPARSADTRDARGGALGAPEHAGDLRRHPRRGGSGHPAACPSGSEAIAWTPGASRPARRGEVGKGGKARLPGRRGLGNPSCAAPGSPRSAVVGVGESRVSRPTGCGYFVAPPGREKIRWLPLPGPQGERESGALPRAGLQRARGRSRGNSANILRDNCCGFAWSRRDKDGRSRAPPCGASGSRGHGGNSAVLVLPRPAGKSQISTRQTWCERAASTDIGVRLGHRGVRPSPSACRRGRSCPGRSCRCW